VSGDSDRDSEESDSSSEESESSSEDSDSEDTSHHAPHDISLDGDSDRAGAGSASASDSLFQERTHSSSYDSIDNKDDSGWDSWDEDDLYIDPNQSRSGTLRPLSAPLLQGPEIPDHESFESGHAAEGDDTIAVETPGGGTRDRSMSREASRSTSGRLCHRRHLNTRFRSRFLADGDDAETSMPSGRHGSNATEGSTMSNPIPAAQGAKFGQTGIY
jgi:hypothetical protein